MSGTSAPAVEPGLPTDLQDERLIRRTGPRGAAAAMWMRIRTGDIGSLPVVLGLVIIWAVFQSLNPYFLSSANLVNLAIECAAVGTIAIGVVLVLLVAQIDLSVGSMSGVASSILGVGLAKLGWSTPMAVVVALVAGVVVGLVYGFIYVRFGVPTFVITLAGLLALLGLQLQILGTNGSINIPFESWIVRFNQQMYLPAVWSYAISVVAALAFASSGLAKARRRAAAGLSAASTTEVVLKAVAMLAVLEVFCWYLNKTRGIGAPFVLFVALVIIVDLALKRTRWGRSVYAVGGSVEGARRAGIKVNRVFVSVLVLGTTLAALGGLLAAGRLATASISSGTGDVNLNAIAAAVIGGTSLFGGRGNAYSALLGIVVIASISSGLTLLSLDSSFRFMITGTVLMIAVIVDSLSRRSRAAHGRA
ncbi:MAG TPA: sugar ABC transporter permease [Actinomycetes bacterium]|nr:sugar ABC transporter permease [Actinomycetes bacterium]